MSRLPHIVELVFYRIVEDLLDTATDHLVLAVDDVNAAYGAHLHMRLLRLCDGVTMHSRIALLIEYNAGTTSSDIAALHDSHAWSLIEAALPAPIALREAELLFVDVT